MGIPKSIYIQDYVLKDLEQDTFGHRHIADAVVDSILATRPPFTIGIFGGWGTGKSSLLEIISSDLPKEKVETVTIDAWRYSSADNLRRAFLVHVANKLTPHLLDDLRRRLFTSEQQTLPGRPSQLESRNKKPWANLGEVLVTVLNLSYKFIGLSILFLLFLFIVFSAITLVKDHSLNDFWGNFDWQALLGRFLDLAFIPLLLALIDDLRLYVIQRPVTIIHERIDADELFSEYFDKVVSKATGGLALKKRLVIFVDNLDRLTDDKMVEALESLKTYLNNDNCIFVVACDDNVVRTVINKSSKIPNVYENNQGDGRAGEHYLDKFFQQTFRLPEYMTINLQDFAERNFETTYLYDRLIKQGVDIRNLVSIVLPSDVGSPRKVKRLLNEFIALYEIAIRRENEKDGQLRSGLLTGNVEFLGKFSTIRAEYPDFYRHLVEDTTLLPVITNLIHDNIEEARKRVDSLNISNQESLLSYLRKTQVIAVDDVEPFIWLSQDTLSLGLKGNQVTVLRTALSNGDTEQVKLLIDNAETPEYKVLVAKVASRMVEQRLVGIEQQNGAKVISNLLPLFDESIRSEIAHVVAALIPQWPVEAFSANEIFNVLRFAQRGGIETQRQKLIDQILSRLNNVEQRQITFDAILQYADVVRRSNGTQRVKDWLSKLIIEGLAAPAAASSADNKELDEKKFAVHQFLEWLISQAPRYSEGEGIIEEYFSGSLLDYVFDRLMGTYKELPAVYLNDGIGLEIEKTLSIIAGRLMQGLENVLYWKGILRLLMNSGDADDVKYSLDAIKTLSNHVPISMIEEFVQGIFYGLENLIPATNDASPDYDGLNSLTDQALNLVVVLRRRKGQNLDKNLLNQLPDHVSKLVVVESVQTSFINFIQEFVKEFGANDGEKFLDGLANAFSTSGDVLLFDPLVNLNEFLNEAQRTKIVEKTSSLVTSNNVEQIKTAYSWIEKIGGLSNYNEILRRQSELWLSQLAPGDAVLLESKLGFFDLLVRVHALTADQLVTRISPHFPFAGNDAQLRVAILEIENVKDKISATQGGLLFQAIVSTIGQFGALSSKALKLIAGWIDQVGEKERDTFNSQTFRLFKTSPVEYFSVLNDSWKGLSVEQIRDQILQFYLVDIDSNAEAERSTCTSSGMQKMDESARSEVVKYIWQQLVVQNRPTEPFMKVAIYSLELDDLLSLRQHLMDLVRENGASEQSESNLRLLAETIRHDTRDLMPMVDLFVNLFGRGQADVQMALKYVVPCLKPLDIRNDHKHKLAEAMGQAALHTEQEDTNNDIHVKADELGLKWFSYRKYWKRK